MDRSPTGGRRPSGTERCRSSWRREKRLAGKGLSGGGVAFRRRQAHSASTGTGARRAARPGRALTYSPCRSSSLGRTGSLSGRTSTPGTAGGAGRAREQGAAEARKCGLTGASAEQAQPPQGARARLHMRNGQRRRASSCPPRRPELPFPSLAAKYDFALGPTFIATAGEVEYVSGSADEGAGFTKPAAPPAASNTPNSAAQSSHRGLCLGIAGRGRRRTELASAFKA